MADIRHNLVIKVAPEKVYDAITTQAGLESWWCKNTIAKPETGFVNVFTFGKDRAEMKVTQLIPNKKVAWQCLDATEEWIGTAVSFDLEDKGDKTLLRFSHANWKNVTDLFAACSYDWARFLASLKSFCETGTGTPA